MAYRRAGRLRWLALAVIGIAAVAAFRAPLLRAVGHALVASDPLPARADAVIVSVDAGVAGVLEAADLVRDGLSQRILVFVQTPSPVDRELARRGLTSGSEEASKRRLLEELGTPGELMPPVNGTTEETGVLSAWCAAHRYTSIVIVTSSDHSRRVRRDVRRTLSDRSLTVAVRPSRYSAFDPDTWWTTRTGLRIGIVEWEKLALDLARHPFG